jgi:hypothetical protein
VNLDHEEWVFRRPRVLRDFSEAHLAVGGDDDTFDAV